MAKQLEEPIAVAEQARPKNRHVFPPGMEEGNTSGEALSVWARWVGEQGLRAAASAVGGGGQK
jgi:hypothetical protein